jgi:cyclin-dependent kinase
MAAHVLEKDKERYQKLGEIGQGTHGVVYKAEDRQTGNIIALKRIRVEAEDDGVPSTAIREISMLKELQQANHNNVVGWLDVISHSKKLNLVFEYLEQDLKRLLSKRRTGLGGPVLQSYMHQMLGGILFCHQRRIQHRDLKP